MVDRIQTEGSPCPVINCRHNKNRFLASFLMLFRSDIWFCYQGGTATLHSPLVRLSLYLKSAQLDSSPFVIITVMTWKFFRAL